MSKGKKKLGQIIVLVVLAVLVGAGVLHWRTVVNMRPGLEIGALHKEGIDGRGINVAIIDQKLLTSHREYVDQLVYYQELGELDGEHNSLHGPAVSSILVGKTCGVAPGASLHYWAVPVRGKEPPGVAYARAILKVVEFNNPLPEPERIRILSISTGFRPEDGGQEFSEAIFEAQNSGILVFSSSYPYFTNPPLAVYNAALASGGSRDNPNNYIVQPDLVTYRGESAEVIASERHQRDREMEYASLWVPVEPRVLASRQGSSRYELFETGGDSWGTPYVAGVAALIIQVNPELSNEQVIEIIANTTERNSNGLQMIAPKQAVMEARNR